MFKFQGIIGVNGKRYIVSFLSGMILLVLLYAPLRAQAAAHVLDPARQVGLVPHKALYSIRLSEKKSSAQVSDLHGKMFYEWQPSCDAWVTTHRFDMTYDYVEAPAVRLTSEFSTYESFDGRDFNFSVQRKRGGQIFEEVRGHAQQVGDASRGDVVYSLPEGLHYDMPEGTLFPMAHTLAVLDKVKSGARFYDAMLFDGSDDEGPVEVNSVFVKKAAYMPSDSEGGIDRDLVSAPGWHVRLAFFPSLSLSETADYEMSVVFHENGVISSMDVDYGDFSVVQELLALEALGDVCEKGRNAD